jgi:hypothetical protein
MRKIIFILAAVAALIVPTAAFAASTQSAVSGVSFTSPSRNITCVYANQYGIGCRTLNNGRAAILHAYTGVVNLNGYVNVRDPWRARALPYGTVTTYGGTFHVASSRSGFDVWSSLTGRGFHIDRWGAHSLDGMGDSGGDLEG